MAGNGFWMSDFIVYKQKRGFAGGKYSLFSMSYCYVSENRSKVTCNFSFFLQFVENQFYCLES